MGEAIKLSMANKDERNLNGREEFGYYQLPEISVDGSTKCYNDNKGNSVHGGEVKVTIDDNQSKSVHKDEAEDILGYWNKRQFPVEPVSVLAK